MTLSLIIQLSKGEFLINNYTIYNAFVGNDFSTSVDSEIPVFLDSINQDIRVTIDEDGVKAALPGSFQTVEKPCHCEE